MTLWIDAQLSPSLAPWVTASFGYDCFSAKYLNLRDAADTTIFWEARKANATVITKDQDFVNLLNQHGSPPKIIWLTCGNTSNERGRSIFMQHLTQAIHLLETSDLVEITG